MVRSLQRPRRCTEGKVDKRPEQQREGQHETNGQEGSVSDWNDASSLVRCTINSYRLGKLTSSSSSPQGMPMSREVLDDRGRTTSDLDGEENTFATSRRTVDGSLVLAAGGEEEPAGPDLFDAKPPDLGLEGAVGSKVAGR